MSEESRLAATKHRRRAETSTGNDADGIVYC